MRLVWLGLACSIAACNRGLTEVSPDQEFDLSVGQSVRVAGRDLVITFESVPADSRCPVDATCVWAGNAQVRLRVRSSAVDSLLELNSFVEPKTGSVGGMSFELRTLEPAPRAGVPVQDRKYRARLLIKPV